MLDRRDPDPAFFSPFVSSVMRVEPAWISDHLCWTGVEGLNLHDLMPLPFTEETVRHVVSRVHAVQDVLGRQLVLENVSTYVSFAADEMTEWEFVREIAQRPLGLRLFELGRQHGEARGVDL